MKKYIRYLKKVTKLSFLRMLSYPGDLITFLCMLPTFFILEILSVFFVFYAGNIQTILGYTIYQIFFVIMLGVWIYQICGMGTIVNDDIEESVIKGRLDFYLIKPLSSTFQLCFRYIYTEGFFILLERTIALIVIIYLGEITFSSLQILQLGYVVISSIILQCTLLILVASMNFYFPRGAGGMQEFLLTLTQSTQEYPKEIYPRWFQKIGLTLIPIFLITNPVFQIFDHTYSLSTFLYTTLIIILFGLATTLLWTNGLRNYQSAN